MAYTRSWNDGTPAGSRAANQIDDAIREFKVDLHERMDSALVTDWSTDPVVVKDSVLGKVTGRIMLFGPHLFSSRNDEDDTDHQDQYFSLNTSGLSSVASPRFPGGITITKLEAAMDRQAAANAVLSLIKYNYTTGVLIGTVDTVTRALGGVGLSAGAGGVLAEVVDSASTTIYLFKFTGAGFVGTGPRLYGVRVTFNIPTSASAS